MGSDISRVTFDPDKHYSGVRQQQGRVNLDADWNEQADITAHRVDTETRDVIGSSGSPRDNAGFVIGGPGTWTPATYFPLGSLLTAPNVGQCFIAIAAGTSGATQPTFPATVGQTVTDGSTGLIWRLSPGDLTVSPGRVYVDGLLCELPSTPVPIENFTGDGTGAAGTQVQVSPALVDSLELAAGQWVQISAQGSQPPMLTQITAVNAAAGSLTFASVISAFGSPNTNPQLQRFATYLSQPDYPSPPALSLGVTSIVYLDVWERTLTAIEAPDIVEVALGGPDSTTRTKTVWQVKELNLGNQVVSGTTPDSSIPLWESVIQPSALQLTTGFVPSVSAGPCNLASNTGYSGLENQLYRVEIHAAGIFGWKANTPYQAGAKVVDSNGNLQIATVAGVSGATAPAWPTNATTAVLDGGTLTWQLVTAPYLPKWTANTAFTVGTRVVDSNGNVQVAVAAGTSGSTSPTWLTNFGTPVSDGTNGLLWQYATPTFKWSRDNGSVATGVTGIASVTNSVGNLASQLTVQSLGRDQVLGFAPGNWVEITDDWQQLNRQPGELHQIDTINVAGKTITLNSPVSSAGFPTTNGLTNPGRHTRLTRWDQSGTVFLSNATTPWVNLAAAGSTGDIPLPPPGTTLLLENGITIAFSQLPVSGPIYSGDYWNFAGRTADGSVQPLTQAFPQGIQHHYCRLAIVNNQTSPPAIQDCRRMFPPLADAGVHVVGIFLGSGVALLNDSTIGIQTDLATGILVVCDAPLDPNSVTQPNSAATISPSQPQATCFLTAGVPALAGGQVIGFTPTMLSANVSLDNSNIIRVNVSSLAIAGLPGVMTSSTPNLLARLTLKGNSIWAADNPKAYLQGNARGTPYTDTSGTQHTGLQLPSGCGGGASDFEMWFWLKSAPQVTLSGTALSFGNQLVGTPSAVQTVTVTNNTTSALAIGSITPSGANATDFAVTNTCGTSVAAGGNCTISVIFTPAAAGARTAQVTVTATPAGASSETFTIALTGTGTQPVLTASATSLAFGTQQAGTTSAPQNVVLTSSGAANAASVSITGIALAGANPSAFRLTSPGTSVLAPGANTAVAIQFAPPAAGSYTATLVVTSNSQPPLPPIALSGTGTAKPKDTKEVLRDKVTVEVKITDTVKVADTVKTAEIVKTTGVKLIDPAQMTGMAMPTPPDHAQNQNGSLRAFIRPEERPPVGPQPAPKSAEEPPWMAGSAPQ